MSASGPPLCRICHKEHWMRDPHILPANAKGEVRSNTRGEVRRVLKAEADGPDATRTAATAKPNPTAPAKAPANKTKAEKARPGKPKTARKAKRKWVKK